MATNKGVSKDKFNDIKAVVSNWYDRHNLVSMLKVVYKDHLANNILFNVNSTIAILNSLYSAGHLSRTDLTLLYETIKLTEQEGLEEDIKEILPSFPNIIDVDMPFSRFSHHRQKIVMFGLELIGKDIQAIDGKINTPKMNYVDGWSMISDFEHRLIICEEEMEKFIEKLKTPGLDNVRKVLEEDITSGRKRKIPTTQEKPKKRGKNQSIGSRRNDNPGSSIRSDVSVRMSEKNQGYIMLSYNHTHKRVVKMIRDRLREKGYDVWIDVEKMAVYVESTMTKAVKEAGIVLICLSEKYEKSRNCKFECDRIQEYNKPFIPLMMEDFDKTNSWLDELIDDRLYVNFKDETTFENSFDELLRLLIRIKWGQEVQNPHPHVHSISSVQEASQPTTSSDQLQGFSVKEPKFTRMIEDISKNIHEEINIWKVALTNHITNVSVLEDANPAKALFDELKRRSVLKEKDASILLEAIKLTDSLRLQKYIPNCPPLENITITHFTKFRQSVIAFGMQLNNVAVGSIAESYSSHCQINRQYTDKWSLIMDLERKTILKDDATSLAGFKSYLVELGLQPLSELLECSG